MVLVTSWERQEQEKPSKTSSFRSRVIKTFIPRINESIKEAVKSSRDLYTDTESGPYLQRMVENIRFSALDFESELLGISFCSCRKIIDDRCFKWIPNVNKNPSPRFMRASILPKNVKPFVKPLLKKQSLCSDDFKNFRPISKLSFLSKVVAKLNVLLSSSSII